MAAPELALDESEAASLANAVAGVGKHYKLPGVSADKLALGVLVWTAGRIYLPRVAAIKARKMGGAAPTVQPSVPPAPAFEMPQTDASAAWFTQQPGNA